MEILKQTQESPVGIWTLSNAFALYCYAFENDNARVGFPNEEMHDKEIKYSKNGRAYINFNKRRFYFDECMRTNL